MNQTKASPPVLAIPAADRTPAVRVPYAAEQHDRAEDLASADRIEAHVDSILAALRAAVPTALARTNLDVGSETAADIAADLTAGLRATHP